MINKYWPCVTQRTMALNFSHDYQQQNIMRFHLSDAQKTLNCTDYICCIWNILEFICCPGDNHISKANICNATSGNCGFILTGQLQELPMCFSFYITFYALSERYSQWQDPLNRIGRCSRKQEATIPWGMRTCKKK